MQLLFGVGDKLAALGEAITSQSVRSGLLKLLLGMVFIAMVWPFLVEATLAAREAITRATAGKRSRKRALQTLQERQQTLDGAPRRLAAKKEPPVERNDTITIKKQVLPQREGKADIVETPLPSPETGPLKTLEELLDYEGPAWGQSFSPLRPPFVCPPFTPLKSRLLVCHDLAGGYGEDRLVQGGGYDRAYRMYDWGLIDIFVYFSHNLVTIPPAGWIDVAHRHGTRILGTFITEWAAGYGVCKELLRSEETAERAATKLTQIAVDYGFDGWLINIENRVDPVEGIGVMLHFLKTLTSQMRAAKSRGRGEGGGNDGNPNSFRPSSLSSPSTVLWYDSVTTEGKLSWQDCLNAANRAFFDACDGIFTNYCWKADYPSACALEAEARRFDVYMGIDTFGRGTWGGGGFDTDKALGKIQRAGVSAALFAPSWTMENETSGGGRVAPSKGQDWREVEQELCDVGAKFWGKVTAAWHAPRASPGPLGGSGEGKSVPLVVNFGRGVGSIWRIRGEEVAAFCAAPGDGQAMHEEEEEGRPHQTRLVGGAFYDLASQCLTPFTGSGRACNGSQPIAVQARLLGNPGATPGGANGTVGVKYSFAESYDGASCLCFTGVLNEKAAAAFTLYSCEVPLPPEPLEVRVTFCCNADSEIALVLLLDVPGHLGGRREVVLRDWGQEGAPAKRPVFSKRAAFSKSKAAYYPIEEEQGVRAYGGTFAENNVHARVRALRDAGDSYESIEKLLRVERAALQSALPSSSITAAGLRGGGGGGIGGSRDSSSMKNIGNPIWITRKFVVRDLRMGGSRAIREIRAVCVRRKVKHVAEGGKGVTSETSSDSGGGLRLGSGSSGGSGRLKGVAGLAAFRACLGEVVIGPWKGETPFSFGKVEGLRAVEVALSEDSGEGNLGGAAVDLSLEWNFKSGEEGAAKNGASHARDVAATLHCDVWKASKEDIRGWTWLGRAYGQKYRLKRLSIDGGGDEGALVLAVQQVNAMGYREPVEDWAQLQLCLPKWETAV